MTNAPTTTEGRLAEIETLLDFLRDREAELRYRLRTDVLSAQQRRELDERRDAAAVKIFRLTVEADALRAGA